VPGRPPPSPATVCLLIVLALALAVGILEHASANLLAQSQAAGGIDPSRAGLARVLNLYLRARYHVLEHPMLYAAGVLFVPALVWLGLRRLAAATNRLRERVSGMQLRTPSYALAHPFGRDPQTALARTQIAWNQQVFATDRADDRVLLGVDATGAPVWVSDRARSMHVQLLGQTGSGKTQSVIWPLFFQDARRAWRDPVTGRWRHRPLVFVDAKGAADNEDQLTRIAAATGRLDHAYLFTLNPNRPTHTYNPLFVPRSARGPAGAEQIAERFFASFEDDMDNPYYKDMAKELFVALVRAVASTGKQMTARDLYAAIKDETVLALALRQATDQEAVRVIESTYDQLGASRHREYTGLLAALRRTSHPALNVYDPDIVLEDVLEDGGIVGFSLSSNAYKFQARAVGLVVLQHLQHIGAQRQMDRQRSQAPLAVYADEFYSFAYPGFLDAVNKLRDAHVSLLLAHQDLSDLERVSPEFARGVWASTRTKIVLYQSDPDLCERLALAVGTEKQVELTVRRNVDGFLNVASSFEASSREVDEYVLHPNHIKALRTGQAYLVQTGIGNDEGVAPRWRWRFWRTPPPPAATRVTGVNLALLQPLPPASLRSPRAPRDTEGIGLYDRFLARGGEPADTEDE